MERMAKDLRTDLEWVATEHHNTEHPHVHIVVQGVRNSGDALRMSRDYIQQGIRSVAEHLCTRQLGYRTQRDAAEAERREITETRFTSLDRRIMREGAEISSGLGPQYLAVTRNPVQYGLGDTARLRTQHEAARLAVLHRMGLAESTGAGTWLVRRDCEQILRAMQRAADRQRTLAAHGALRSDERLPVEVLDPIRMIAVEGRVLVHGQDEQSGRNYLMLEGTDARVYFVHYTPEMERARSHGQLRINSFVRIRKLSRDRVPLLDVQDLGDAERLLRNARRLSEAASQLLKRGVVPVEDGWGGWLGRYQAALSQTATEMSRRRENKLERKHQRKRQRDCSLGR
jgi:hypothetical protein